ncbi:MAG: hypothetical protein ACR2OD_09360, partial [Gaiellaceae bacterium]
GAVIGCVFGVARWACAALGALVRTPRDLAGVAALLSRLERPAQRATVAVQLAAIGALVAVLAL